MRMRIRIPLTLALGLFWLLPSGCSQDKPEEERFDCANIPSAPLEINQVENGGDTLRPAGHHDLAFDREGWITGHHAGALIRASLEPQRQVLSTAVSTAEGLEYLPDGRLIVATKDGQGIVAISPDGAVVPLEPSRTDAFSIIVGPDGRIYTGDFSGGDLRRIDPATGASENYLNSVPDARVLNFSPDLSKLYVGTFGEQVWVVDLDKELNPVGTPRRFATLPHGPYVDGLAVDVCGNPVYPEDLYRITPDGTLSTYHHWSEASMYGHGLKWGSGIGGWRRDALYSPQPWNDGKDTVVEVVVGVPGFNPASRVHPSGGDPHELTCAASGRRTRSPAGLLLLLALGALWLGRDRSPSRS